MVLPFFFVDELVAVVDLGLADRAALPLKIVVMMLVLFDVLFKVARAEETLCNRPAATFFFVVGLPLPHGVFLFEGRGLLAHAEDGGVAGHHGRVVG